MGVIKKPMDLSQVRANLRDFKYTSRKEFMDDINLIVSNCKEYCTDKFPYLPPQADALLAKVELLISENEKEVVELERSANSDDNSTSQTSSSSSSSSSKKKRKTPQKKKSSSGSNNGASGSAKKKKKVVVKFEPAKEPGEISETAKEPG